MKMVLFLILLTNLRISWASNHTIKDVALALERKNINLVKAWIAQNRVLTDEEKVLADSLVAKNMQRIQERIQAYPGVSCLFFYLFMSVINGYVFYRFVTQESLLITDYLSFYDSYLLTASIATTLVAGALIAFVLFIKTLCDVVDGKASLSITDSHRTALTEEFEQWENFRDFLKNSL